MNNEIQTLINKAVKNMIEHTSSEDKLKSLYKKHEEKIHFIPKRYRVFGGLLQSMNIQFGNFIEELMRLLIENEGKYQILTKYSGKKSNAFYLSKSNDNIIDEYITNCQIQNIDTTKEFPKLMDKIVNNTDTTFFKFTHDIDLLFQNKQTGIIYYLEMKYNDDHDTGKFVDINRKIIKTYAYLTKELNIKEYNKLVPILFFFTDKRLKGNIYLPENINIKRGHKFFDEFLTIKYNDVDSYLTNLSESPETIKMFDSLYHSVMNHSNK